MAGAQSEGHENLTGADCKRIAKGVQDYAWEGIHDVLRVSLSLPPPRLTSSITTDNCPNGGGSDETKPGRSTGLKYRRLLA